MLPAMEVAQPACSMPEQRQEMACSTVHHRQILVHANNYMPTKVAQTREKTPSLWQSRKCLILRAGEPPAQNRATSYSTRLAANSTVHSAHDSTDARLRQLTPDGQQGYAMAVRDTILYCRQSTSSHRGLPACLPAMARKQCRTRYIGCQPLGRELRIY